MGLTPAHGSAHERFEVDGANAARDFLRSHGIRQDDIDTVWTAIALHTTPGIPRHMHPVIALVTAGVEMDVLGIAYRDYSEVDVPQSCMHIHAPAFQGRHHPGVLRRHQIQADTTFGNVKADVLADKDPTIPARQFLQRDSRESAWRGLTSRDAFCTVAGNSPRKEL